MSNTNNNWYKYFLHSVNYVLRSPRIRLRLNDSPILNVQNGTMIVLTKLGINSIGLWHFLRISSWVLIKSSQPFFASISCFLLPKDQSLAFKTYKFLSFAIAQLSFIPPYYILHVYYSTLPNKKLEVCVLNWKYNNVNTNKPSKAKVRKSNSNCTGT